MTLADEIHGIAEMLRNDPSRIGLAAMTLDIIASRVCELERRFGTLPLPEPEPVVVSWQGAAEDRAWANEFFSEPK